MKQINLKDIYPYYTEDQYVMVSDEVADLISEAETAEKSHERKERRYRATVAYDHLRFCAHNAELIMPSAADEYERETLGRQMYNALSSIPPVQANRIVAHYIDGKSFHEIAEEEGVKKMTIFVSIRLGMRNLKKILKMPQNRTDESAFFVLYNEGTFSFPGET